jgi:hypothetical protein
MATAFFGSMPPDDWDYGPIPEECYNKDLSVNQIEALLKKSYYTEERIKTLAGNDSEINDKTLLRAQCQIEIVMQMDAETIYTWNLR